MAEFSISLPYEVEEGVEVELNVYGDYASSPGSRRGHPDRWTDAWSELHVERVTNTRGCELPAAVVDRLCESWQFLDEVQRRVEAQ